MTKAILIAAAMMWPALTWAEVNINVDVHAGTNPNVYECEDGDYVEYSDYDEPPWYEDECWHGPVQERVEYRWSIISGMHVLQFRKVIYHTGFHSWNYGPWMVKFEFCLPGCTIHHHHHFCDRCGNPFWDRHIRYWNVFVVKHRQHHPQPVYKYYRYEGPRPVIREERREHFAPQYRHEEPSQSQPQAPVRRPPVRPVPGQYQTNLSSDGGSGSSQGLHKTNETYRPEQLQSRSSNNNRIQKRSGRTIVWQK